MVGDARAKTLVVPMRLAGAALLGLLAAFALASCGGDGEAIGTGAVTLPLTGVSVPARTAPAVTETVTLTETAAAVTETETVTLTETAAPPATLASKSASERPMRMGCTPLPLSTSTVL